MHVVDVANRGMWPCFLLPPPLPSVLPTKLAESSGPELETCGRQPAWLSKLAAAFLACVSTLANCFMFDWGYLLPRLQAEPALPGQ